MYARVPQVMAQFVLKNRKIVPYHGTNPNTRNGARIRSPSPIMAPGGIKVVMAAFLATLYSIVKL